jgi:hypothetical protein
VALGVINSFKILTEAEGKTKESATPEPIPLPKAQGPSRARSDATDEGLPGIYVDFPTSR